MNAIRGTCSFVLLSVLGTASFCQSQAAEPQFEETFESLSPQLGNVTSTLFAQDGVLVAKPSAGFVTRLFYNGVIFEDADISVRVRQVEGKSQDYGVGLNFWAEPPAFYAWLITPSGSYMVARYTGAKWSNPIPWRTSEAIKKGIGEWNKLRVVTKGKQATFFINDAEITSIRGQPPEGGGLIGLEANSPKEETLTWELDDLRVE
jgi:hypothetical protein